MSSMGTFWDEMYADDAYRYGTSPNRWLVACADRIAPGSRALSIGDGEGRNGVWLAEQGATVVTIDSSQRGVEKARALAAERGVGIDARCGLFPDGLGDEAPFDVIVLAYIHARPEQRAVLHSAAADLLASGGYLILEGFTPAQIPLESGGPKDPEMLFTASLLQDDFSMLHIVHLEERRVVLGEGPGHAGDAEVVRLLAMKPLA